MPYTGYHVSISLKNYDNFININSFQWSLECINLLISAVGWVVMWLVVNVNLGEGLELMLILSLGLWMKTLE